MYYKTIFVDQKVIEKRDTLNSDTSVYHEYITICCDISGRVLNVDGENPISIVTLTPI